MDAKSSVYSFLSAAELVDVRTRACTLDVSAAVQTAIDTVAEEMDNGEPMGILRFPAGSYRIGRTLKVDKPILLLGAGQGAPSPYTPAASELLWYADDDAPLLIYGGNGEVISGGGVSRMRIAGRGICRETMQIIDAQQFTMSALQICNGTFAALSMMNGAGVLSPTGLGTFDNIMLYEQGGTTDNGRGLYVSGEGGGFSGVTLMLMNQMTVLHVHAPGIEIKERGDNFTWTRLLTVRGDNDSPEGYGVAFTSTNPTGTVSSGHVFIDPACSGGFHFKTAGLQDGTCIINYSALDLNPNAQPTSGAGASEVSITTHDGRLWGQDKTLGYRETIHHDAMRLIWATPNVVQTNAGAWAYRGVVADGGLAGGAVRLITGSVAGSVAELFDGAAESGVTVAMQPNLIFTYAPEQVEGVVIRAGLKNGEQGIYVEIDPAKTPIWYRCVVKDATGETVVTTEHTGFNYYPGISGFRIEIQPGYVNFFAGKAPFNIWAFVGTVTTHIPVVPLASSYAVTSTTAGVKSLKVCDHKLGYNTEK